MWAIFLPFFFFFCIHDLAVTFVEHNILPKGLLRIADEPGGREGGLKSLRSFSINHLTKSHVSSEFWVFEKYGMLKQRSKMEDYGHTCECKEMTLNLPQVMPKSWEGKVQLKGKWKCIHVYLSGFCFSLEASGYRKILTISCSKGRDLCINWSSHIYWWTSSERVEIIQICLSQWQSCP